MESRHVNGRNFESTLQQIPVPAQSGSQLPTLLPPFPPRPQSTSACGLFGELLSANVSTRTSHAGGGDYGLSSGNATYFVSSGAGTRYSQSSQTSTKYRPSLHKYESSSTSSSGAASAGTACGRWQPYTSKHFKTTSNEVIEMSVPKECHGFIIGFRGKTISRISKETGTNISMPPKDSSGNIRIEGIRESIEEAKKQIYQVVSEMINFSKTLAIPEVYYPFVKAKKKAIENATGALLAYDDLNNKLTIWGEKRKAEEISLQIQCLCRELENTIKSKTVKLNDEQSNYLLSNQDVISEIFEATGVWIEFSSSNMTLYGPEQMIQEALSHVLQKSKNVVKKIHVSEELRNFIDEQGSMFETIQRDHPNVNMKFGCHCLELHGLADPVLQAKRSVEKWLNEKTKNISIEKIELPNDEFCTLIKEHGIVKQARNEFPKVEHVTVEVIDHPHELRDAIEKSDTHKMVLRKFPTVKVEYFCVWPGKIRLHGPPSEVQQAKKAFEDLITNLKSTEIQVDKKYHGLIFGKRGIKVDRIAEETKTSIILPKKADQSDIIRIYGKPSDIMIAKAKILETVDKARPYPPSEKAYEKQSGNNDDFEVLVPPTSTVEELSAEDIEVLVSTFGEIVRKHGPVNPDDPKVMEFLSDGLKNKIRNSGGIAELLVNSGRFAMQGKLIFPVDGPDASNDETGDDESEEEFISRISEAFKCSEKIARRLAHAMLIGPPGSGKSSLMDRLLQRLRREFATSTGVAEGIVSVEVRYDEKQSTFHAALVIEGEWKEYEFNESLFSHMSLNQDLSPQPSQPEVPESAAQPDSASFQPVDMSSELPEPAVRPHEMPTLPDKLSSILVHVQLADQPSQPRLAQSMISYLRKKFGSYKKFKKYMEKGYSLYLRDTGGQFEFQEMLPLLIFGPSIFIFVFRLDLSFEDKFQVIYRQKDGVYNDYTSSITIEEALLQCLANVDIIRKTEKDDIETREPSVFIVGTHKDKLEEKLKRSKSAPSLEKKICQLNIRLDALLKEHGINDLVSYAGNDSEHVMFTVNNVSGEEKDFELIRSRINAVISCRDEFIIQYPINYLLFCLDLQNIKDHIIPLEEFRLRAGEFGIEGDRELSKLLHFLCNRIGIIQYFNKDKVRHLVVNQPPFLYKKVSDLVIETFKGKTLLPTERKDLEKGILSYTAAKSIIGSGSQISTQELLELLVQLRIIASYKEGKYFIPCILNHLPEASREEEVTDDTISPLYITFGCNYCPKGLFAVLITYLMSLEDNVTSLNLQFNQEKVSKDHVSFTVESGEDTLDLLSVRVVGCSHLEVNLIPDDPDSPLVTERCSTIRELIESYLDKSFDDLHYNKDIVKYEMCLKCERCSKLHQVLVNSHKLRCNYKKIPVPAKGKYWFKRLGSTAATATSSQPSSCSTKLSQMMPSQSVLPSATECQAEKLELQDVPNDDHKKKKLTLLRVSGYLRKVSNVELVDVGVKLGLDYVKLENMKSKDNFLSGMLTAWLRRDDNVKEDPSWRSLCQALRECGLNGIADTIEESEMI